MYRTGLISSLALAAMLAACGGGDDPGSGIPDPDTIPAPVAPTSVALVTDGDQAGFESPLDAVSSHDGRTFYFSAYTSTPAEDAESAATIYSVSSTGGDPQVLFTGAPLKEPAGLLMSCDGSTLYIADIGHKAGDADDLEEEGIASAPIYQLDISSKSLSALPVSGIGEAASMAIATDCSSIYATGYTPDNQPALFQMSPEGGAATVIKQGEPLDSPTGLYVDADSVAWVMDHQPNGEAGGILFAINPDGTTQSVADGLRLSEPAGVSLVAGGDIAVIPNRDENQASQLITVSTVSGEMTLVEAPELIEPAGIRTAIAASVMALVDADGHAIYRVE